MQTKKIRDALFLISACAALCACGKGEEKSSVTTASSSGGIAATLQEAIENTKDNYKLDVFFDDGKHVLYDVSDDIKNIPDFADLKTQYALFNNFTLDQSRTCITWSDRIDLSSDSIYQYGVEIN